MNPKLISPAKTSPLDVKLIYPAVSLIHSHIWKKHSNITYPNLPSILQPAPPAVAPASGNSNYFFSSHLGQQLGSHPCLLACFHTPMASSSAKASRIRPPLTNFTASVLVRLPPSLTCTLVSQPRGILTAWRSKSKVSTPS